MIRIRIRTSTGAAAGVVFTCGQDGRTAKKSSKTTKTQGCFRQTAGLILFYSARPSSLPLRSSPSPHPSRLRRSPCCCAAQLGVSCLKKRSFAKAYPNSLSAACLLLLKQQISVPRRSSCDPSRATLHATRGQESLRVAPFR